MSLAAEALAMSTTGGVHMMQPRPIIAGVFFCVVSITRSPKISITCAPSRSKEKSLTVPRVLVVSDPVNASVCRFLMQVSICVAGSDRQATMSRRYHTLIVRATRAFPIQMIDEREAHIFRCTVAKDNDATVPALLGTQIISPLGWSTYICACAWHERRRCVRSRHFTARRTTPSAYSSLAMVFGGRLQGHAKEIDTHCGQHSVSRLKPRKILVVSHLHNDKRIQSPLRLLTV